MFIVSSVADTRGSVSYPTATTTRATTTAAAAARNFMTSPPHAVPHGLLRSIPTVRHNKKRRRSTHSSSLASTMAASSSLAASSSSSSSDTSTTIHTRERFRLPNLPHLSDINIFRRLPFDPHKVRQRLHSSIGLYYGLTPQYVVAPTTTTSTRKIIKPARVALQDTMVETLEELRTMRQEMEALRRELQAMKRQMGGGVVMDESTITTDRETDQQLKEGGGTAATKSLLAKRKRQKEFDALGTELEKWGVELLFEQAGEVEGWVEVQCNRVLRSAFNRDDRTRAYVKWMKDSRGKYAAPDDNREYPCIRIYSTLDAPLEEVCLYLSQVQHMGDYNDLVAEHRDLEEITTHSKICWGATPQILFVKARELVTFCHHRWRRDGTQVVVNQACDFTGIHPTAFALRGATFIGRDPDDPEHKTSMSMVAHANPGSDVPAWACRTAVNALAPVEPFKLFHKINEGIQRCRTELERELQNTDMEGSTAGSNSCARPAGLSLLGFACFWPNGGGTIEGPINDGSDDCTEKLNTQPGLLPDNSSSSSSLSEEKVNMRGGVQPYFGDQDGGDS